MKNIYKRRLDDQAKIFSLSCNRTDTSLFRLSTNLKQKVDKDILQKALLLTLEKYKAFKVKVRRGFFWYYLDENKKEPIISNKIKHNNYSIQNNNEQGFFQELCFDFHLKYVTMKAMRLSENMKGRECSDTSKGENYEKVDLYCPLRHSYSRYACLQHRCDQ